MVNYRRLSELVAAIRKGEVPAEVVSPGGASDALGVSRQRVAKLLKVGKLESWQAEGVVLVSSRSIMRYAKARERWLRDDTTRD